jgi:hypothetical protein
MSNANFPRDLKLPDALRALPQVAPGRSAWPELAARLAAAPGVVAPARAADRARAATLARRRYFVPAALAAAAVLAFAALQLQQGRLARTQPAAVATVAPAAASSVENAANSTNASDAAPGSGAGAERIAALQQRSQALEHWLRETAGSGTPLPGEDLAAATEIEDMIGLVDMQLGAGSRDSGLALWKRRVALLEDLTALRYSSYSVAENGVAASTPANWTN